MDLPTLNLVLFNWWRYSLFVGAVIHKGKYHLPGYFLHLSDHTFLVEITFDIFYEWAVFCSAWGWY
jgi:hypothetical protein